MINSLQIEDWHWEITRNCNQRCAHCIIGNMETGEMSTDMAMSAIIKVASLGGKRLHITGGEPFIRNDLRLLVNQARTNGLSVNIITNGILQDVILPFVKNSLIEQIGISIDGNEPAHDLIRGYGSYRKTVATLEAIIETESAVRVYLTINALSINYLGEVIAELVGLGVNSFQLKQINHEGRVKTNHCLEINGLSEEEKIKIISSQLDSLIEIGDLTVDCSCAISPRVAYLDFNGNVYSCVELAMANSETMIASLFDTDFIDKFQSYHSDIKIPSKCRYSFYSTSGVDICLNCTDSCPAVKER